MNKIVYLKLVTGEHIVGKLSNSNDETIVIDNPFVVIMNPANGGLGLIPYEAPYLGRELDSIDIKKDFILHEFEPPKELWSEYKKIITGIETVSTSKIIT